MPGRRMVWPFAFFFGMDASGRWCPSRQHQRRRLARRGPSRCGAQPFPGNGKSVPQSARQGQGHKRILVVRARCSTGDGFWSARCRTKRKRANGPCRLRRSRRWPSPLNVSASKSGPYGRQKLDHQFWLFLFDGRADRENVWTSTFERLFFRRPQQALGRRREKKRGKGKAKRRERCANKGLQHAVSAR